jgi:hypothetical protein
MAVPAQPAQPSLGARLRSLAHRIHVTKNPAAWAVIGATAGVVITGSISIVTANIAAETSVKTAEIAKEVAVEGAKAAAAQSQSDFIRTQRLNVYTSYLTQSIQFHNAVYAYSGAVQQGPPALTQDKLDSLYSNLGSTYGAFVDAAWRVRQIASEPVDAASQEMNSYVDETYTALERPLGTSQVDAAKVKTVMDPFPQKMGDFRTQFSEVSRTEFIGGH